MREPARGREVDPGRIMGYGRFHRNQRAASPLASAFILAVGAAGVVSTTVRCEAQNVAPLAQSASHERYVLGQDGLAR